MIVLPHAGQQILLLAVTSLYNLYCQSPCMQVIHLINLA